MTKKKPTRNWGATHVIFGRGASPKKIAKRLRKLAKATKKRDRS